MCGRFPRLTSYNRPPPRAIPPRSGLVFPVAITFSHGYGSHGAATWRQDLCDRFDIEFFGEIDDSDMVMNDTSQAFDHFEDGILREENVRLAIGPR